MQTQTPRPKFSMFITFQCIYTLRTSNVSSSMIEETQKKGEGKGKKTTLKPASEFRFNLLQATTGYPNVTDKHDTFKKQQFYSMVIHLQEFSVNTKTELWHKTLKKFHHTELASQDPEGT